VAEKVRVLTIKTGMPTVEEARATLNSEIDKAKRSGIIALKIVHGYGASGVGGRLRDAIRASLRKRRKEGKIRSFVTGEQWAAVEAVTRELLEECPELRRDMDLNRYNEGITFVLL
jgi:hypothetical protein